MKTFQVYLQDGIRLQIQADKFEINYYTGKADLNFFKSESEIDNDIAIKFDEVMLIIPNEIESGDKTFRFYFKDGNFYDLDFDHFKIWDSDRISLRDADNKHLTDFYVKYSLVRAIIPLE